MELTFLGTSSMVPTKERNHAGIFLAYRNEGILFDCGEGMQRQFKIAGIALPKITRILITHWHGDHVLGLPGVMQTLSALNYEGTLRIYGPKGTKKRIEALFEAFVFDRKLDFEVHEVNEGIFFENRDFRLEAFEMDHGIETFAFKFIEKDARKIDMKKSKKLGLPEGPLIGKLQDGHSVELKGKTITPEDVSQLEPGRKIAYVTDTNVCNNCYKAAQDSDVFICEATYTSKLSDKSEEHNHMTAKQAAHIANNSNVKKLVLTHFSARYKTTTEVEDDAKNLFENTTCAQDFMKIKL
jgi:ribonuclease Z